MVIKKEMKQIEIFTYVCPLCKRKLEAYTEGQMNYNIKIHNDAIHNKEVNKKESDAKS